MKIYKVGLLVEGKEQPGWIHDLLAWLLRNPQFDLCTVMIDTSGKAVRRQRVSAKAMLGTLSRLETRLLAPRQRDLLACRDLEETLNAAQVPVIRLQAGELGTQSGERIDALALDLLITLGPTRVARQDMLAWAKQGVWQLSHSDMAMATSNFAGFWEVFQREDHTTVKLWRLAEKVELDQLLDQRSFNTEVYWLKNQARAFSLGNFMLCDALDALTRVRQLGAPQAVQISTGRRRNDPKEWASAAYVARQAWLMTDLVVRRIMKRNVRWRIGLFPSTRSNADVSEAVILQPPKGHFFADPFVYVHNNKTYIFFEDYDFARRKGQISVASYENGAFSVLGTPLDLPYHLSFPFIFEYEGATYMVPETCGNRTIELWKCTDFPLQWELDKTLMKDISAVDTMIFKREGYWWLLTNIDRSDGQNHCDELFAYFSDSPRSDSWTPHAANPIVRNPSKARNAGMVRSPNGDVARCAQTQGFCHYGKGVSLNRIEELSPSTYAESDGQIHYAGFLQKRHASMHHWHNEGENTVFDFAYIE